MAESNIPPALETENCEEERAANMEMTPDSDTAMDRFLQKTRSDLMYELRQIKFGERPVTGRDSRQNIDQFFAKHLEAAPGSEGKENVPANVDRVEEHRPESVVVEVQGLFEQQRVSSMLQSTMFRRSLERIIRNSITPSSTASPRNTSPPLTTPRSTTPARRESPLVQPQVNVPAPDVRSRAESQESIQSVASSSSSSSSASEIRVPSPANAAVESHERVEGVIPPSAMPTWPSIAEVHREELVQEISDLLHNRLVSSTLEGEFRGTLEVQMQNRLAATGGNGSDVENFVRNLPNHGHLRNDFSHLGIQGPQDNWDNISVTSISATAVPYTQSNLHLSREIRSLKSQMEEMKNMIKLSFDLQLDIQRAIRQEVAGAIAAATGTTAQSVKLPESRPVDDSHCLICLENTADSVLYQCGHLCLCYACGKHLVSQSGKCPVCRAPIKDIIRAYKCNSE